MCRRWQRRQAAEIISNREIITDFCSLDLVAVQYGLESFRMICADFPGNAMPRVAVARGKRAREQVFRTDPAYLRLGQFESFVDITGSFPGKSQSIPSPRITFVQFRIFLPHRISRKDLFWAFKLIS
jgi:hypothetical protein